MDLRHIGKCLVSEGGFEIYSLGVLYWDHFKLAAGAWKISPLQQYCAHRPMNL